ncbi:MAG: hypothetical protein WBG46_10870 [Nonlabens sp.]
MKRKIFTLTAVAIMAISLNSCKEEDSKLENLEDQLEQRSDDLEDASDDIGDAADDIEDAIENLKDALEEIENVEEREEVRKRVNKIIDDMKMEI